MLRSMILLFLVGLVPFMFGCSKSTQSGGDDDTDTLVTGDTNLAPTSDAGSDQAITIGDTAYLDGSASSDPDGDSLFFQWTMMTRPSGSNSQLETPGLAQTMFVPDSVGIYKSQLIVTDGFLPGLPDTVQISVESEPPTPNQPPVAIAGTDQVITTTDTASLNGNASYDPEGGSLSFRWTIIQSVGGAVARLLDTDSSVTPFLADSEGSYILRLRVTDTAGAQGYDSVTVMVENAPLVDSCQSDPEVELSHHITDLSKIEIVIPPGAVSGNVIKTHSYLGNKTGEKVPLYAPVDCALINGAKMLESDIVQYILFFRVSCEVQFLFDHVTEVVSSIDSMFPGPPAQGSQTGDNFDPPLYFSAGDLIGYAEGTPQAGRWDFGVYNTEHTNVFGNNERYELTHGWRWLNAVCPYELFPANMKAEYEALYGGAGGVVVGGGDCRNPSQDLVGTVRGMWFPDPDTATFTDGDGFAITTTFDEGMVRMAGPGWNIWVYSDEATYADPATVTSEHCYSDGQSIAYLKLISNDELRVYYNGSTGTCPDSFPSTGYTTYWR